MHWRRRIHAGFLVFTMGLLACGGGGDGAYRRVVLVAVEGLRLDHLSHRGYPRQTSPFLDELAASGVSFDRAYAQSARTATSAASLLTSRLPEEHGVFGGEQQSLPDSLPTLAEAAARAGVQTAAIVADREPWSEAGLLRGFEHVDAPSEYAHAPYRPAPEMAEIAAAWALAQGTGAASLLFLCLGDTKPPWTPPNDAFEPVRNGPEREAFTEALVETQRLPMGFFKYEYRRIARVMNPYDADLHWLDRGLARLHEGLAAAGWSDDTLWVVTATQGMGLGHHLWLGDERQLYETLVRVPLIVHAGDGSLAPRRESAVVQHLDLAPTLLELLGAGPLEGARGRSLAAGLAGAELASAPVLIQRGPSPERAKEPPIPGGPGPDPDDLDAWVEERFKLIRSGDGSVELYDVAADPYETDDLAETEPETVERLRARLEERLTQLGRPGLQPADGGADAAGG